MAGIKRLFWKGDDEGEEPKSSEDPGVVDEVARTPRRQKVEQTLSALRTGPSANIFQRTTGLSPATTSVQSQARPEVDSEFDAVILETLDRDSKESGYREFMTQFTALSGIITDRAQCTAAAIAAVSASNPKLNATQIVRSIGERIQLLAGYQAEYERQSSESETAESADKTSAISEKQRSVQDLDAEIARLQGERSQTMSEIGRLQSELSGVTTKYDGYRGRFVATVNARREELKSISNLIAPSAVTKGV